jgi:hypothetical protein
LDVIFHLLDGSELHVGFDFYDLMEGPPLSLDGQSLSVKVEGVLISILLLGRLDDGIFSVIIRNWNKDLRSLIADTLRVIGLSSVRQVESLIADRHGIGLEMALLLL